jgi:hypothetical protein
MLTGRPPFKGASLMETLEQVLTQAVLPPSLLQQRLPRDLEVVCLKCLHKAPEGRYPTAQALADDLDRFLAGEPVRARAASLVEQVAHLLGRSQHDVRFHGWGNRLLWLSPLPLLAQVPVFVLALTGRPLVAATLLVSLGSASCIVLGLWLGRSRSQAGPAERQMWSILVGHLLGMALLAIVSWPVRAAEALALYPRWAILTGVEFFSMGAGYWGGFYLLGLAFLVLAVPMALWPEAAPLGMGALMTATLLILGTRLRRVAPEARNNR